MGPVADADAVEEAARRTEEEHGLVATGAATSVSASPCARDAVPCYGSWLVAFLVGAFPFNQLRARPPP